MNEWLAKSGLEAWVRAEQVMVLLKAALILVGGTVLARIAGAAAGRMVEKRVTRQGKMLTRRVVFFALLALVMTSTLHQLGFKMGVLLGAAGVITVALGFASQTSVSNLISGLFLIAERHFEVGDIIVVDDVTGEVLSIDFLSVKLRTFDNLSVRVPNENLIKSRVTNLTKFPIRRLDLRVGVAYKENIARVKEVLLELADRNHLCLDEPKPLFIFANFGDSALELQFSVWAKRENFLDLINSVREDVKNAFDKNGIEIPFPHRTVYTGAVTEPFPIRVVNSGSDAAN